MDPLYDAVLSALERATNRLLELDPESMRRIEAMQGALVEVRVRATALRVYVEAQARELRITREAARAPDAIVAGTPFALLRSLTAGSSGTPTSAGELEIDGDTDAVAALRDLVRNLDIDWEEMLSRIVGDVIAHQIGNAGRAVREWSAESRSTLERNLSDYLREEAELLAGRSAAESFATAVDTLRADADRLELRLARLRALLQADETATTGRSPR